MHIALVAREAFAPGVTGQAGGIGRYVEAMSGALAALGARVTVIAQSPDAALRQEMRDGVTLARLPKWDDASPHSWRWHELEAKLLGTALGREVWADLSDKIRRARMVDRWLPRLQEQSGAPFDVVEFAECGAEGLFYLSRKRRPPCVVRVHCPTQLLVQNAARRATLGKRLLVRLERLAAKRADHVTAPSRSAAGLAQGDWRLTGRQPIVLPNLYDSAVFRPQAGRPRAGSFTILYSGRLDPLKGVAHFPAVLSRLAAGGIDFQVRCIGRDTDTAPGNVSMRQWFLDAVGDAVRERLHFPGHLGAPELTRELQAASVGLYLSAYETFGYTALEAQACGLPVVASGNGGMGEVVIHGETGFLVDPCDHEAIAGHLRRLHDDPALRGSMGEAAARHAARHFSLRAKSPAFARFYAAIAAAGRSRAADVLPAMQPEDGSTESWDADTPHTQEDRP